MEDRIAALRARVASLSVAERDAFRVKVEAAGIDWARVAPVEAGRPDRLPLSPGQMHFWLGQQVHPDSAAFSIAFAWDITGPLDAAVLARALDWLVVRHEPLRTAFPSEDGRPWQQILEPGFTMTRADIAPAEAPDAERAFVAQPFDLARAPLFRAHLLRQAADRHRLLLSFHHIIADGWSRGVFLRELAECYRAFRDGRTPDLPGLPRHFVDLVLDRHRWLATPAAAAQQDFWRAELVGLPPQELPSAGPSGDHAAETLLHRIDPALAARVAPAAAAMGVTPFVLLLAVFQLLQHRLTGSDDVAVGTPIAGRGPEAAQMIGLFLNTLVLRARPCAGLAFRDWLGQVRTGFLRAFDHQDLPFARVVEAVGAERRADQTPLFQVLFQVQSGYGAQNADSVDLGDPRLSVRQEVMPLPQAKFDLSWHMIDRDGGLSVIAEYRWALFGAGHVRRMIAGFETLLAAALDRPDAAIETLDFVPATAVTTLRGPDSPIPDLLAMMRAAAPAAALVCAESGETYTGEALHAQADALARRLRARPELADGQPLAICLSRGPQMIVALLAALKAGIPYVPLDPAHPAGRRAAILEDAGVGLMLADEAEISVCPVLDPEALAGGPQADLPAPDPDRIAYVIFTSGSTGRPKGVPVTHRALSNLIAAMAAAPGMRPGGRWLALTTIAFDIAALELLLPLAVGATLVLADAETAAAPERLAAALDRHRITHMQATPATWRLLLDSGWKGRPDLVALCGGEALPSDLGGALLARVGALWNMYGPTETTIWSAARHVRAGDLTGPQARIGGPVANTTLQVLDRYGQPLPAGIPGELAIGGAGLSPGYWQRPDLTAQRFAGGAYLTGDRVRLEGDGTLSFLGRLDHQIKLNGYRIEPGEIEAALRDLPGIAEALVLAEGGRLVAWCRPDGPGTGPGDLRAGLADRLPAYMIPAVFVMLDRFPLNPNGKIDRARLPKPDQPVRRDSRAPATPAERELLAIWAEVLGRDDLGVEDNFFGIGGASVSAMQIASRARARGLMLTPAQMFQHQTVAAQAAVAEPPAVRSETLPLSPWQAAMRSDPGAPLNLCRPVGPEAAARLDQALRTVTAAHPVLRFALTDEGWRTDTVSDLWSARVVDGMLDLSLYPLLLDAPSAEKLADQMAALLRGETLLPEQDGDAYAGWLRAGRTGTAPDPALLQGDGPGAADPLVRHLDAGALRILRANAQAANVVPSRIAAAALARVLASWADGTLTLALAEHAPCAALGHFARLLPLHLEPSTDPTASLRAVTRAEAECDPRGADPRGLPDGFAALSWDLPADLPAAALHVAATTGADGLMFTWHSRAFRPDTVARLAARFLAELSVPLTGGASKLDRLRAKLRETQG